MDRDLGPKRVRDFAITCSVCRKARMQDGLPYGYKEDVCLCPPSPTPEPKVEGAPQCSLGRPDPGCEACQ